MRGGKQLQLLTAYITYMCWLDVGMLASQLALVAACAWAGLQHAVTRFGSAAPMIESGSCPVPAVLLVTLAGSI